MTQKDLLHGVNFSVGIKEARVELDGKAVHIPNRFVTYRKDNGAPLDIVGGRYRVHQHTETIKRTACIIEKFTSNFDVKHKIEGARIYSRFTLHNMMVLEKNEQEQARLAIELLNTHDGSRSVRLDLSVWRLICTNGMMGFVSAENLKQRHVKSVTLGTLFENLPALMDTYHKEYVEIFNKLSGKKVISKDKIEKALPVRLVKKAREIYPVEKKIAGKDNAWAQYQAFTRVISHEKIQENRKIELSHIVSNFFLSQAHINS